MIYVSIIFFFIAVAFMLFTWGTIWSRRETWVRLASLLGLVLVIVSLAPMAMETLGWHKPQSMAWRLDGKSVVVLSSKMIRNEGIYLYLDVGPGEPRAVVLPWDDEVAEKLQEARRGSRERGYDDGRTMMEFDITPDLNARQFHPMPQPRLPIPKGEPDEAPPTYERGA